jgi:lipopolysaccharide/colanic/teichoic acid biosynthesis glycosyltransferase
VVYPHLKRVLDVTASAAGLVVLMPVIGVLAVAIKLDSTGPVFYRGERIGLGGRPFRMLKFRTMVSDAERRGGTSTSDRDPRITRVGRALRRGKLDELPQLLNVLAGDMSLVGPRPQVAHDVAKYSAAERALLSVRPGITDYASIRFRDEGRILAGEPDPDEAYIRLIRPEKIRLGLEYVETASLAVDLKILVRTALSMFGSSEVRR